jgi:hypothetical protein
VNIIDFIKNLIGGNKSVASITAHLHDTVAELEAHMSTQYAKAADKSAAAAKALKERVAHEEEAAAASKVAQNIKALLG